MGFKSRTALPSTLLVDLSSFPVALGSAMVAVTAHEAGLLIVAGATIKSLHFQVTRDEVLSTISTQSPREDVRLLFRLGSDSEGLDVVDSNPFTH